MGLFDRLTDPTRVVEQVQNPAYAATHDELLRVSAVAERALESLAALELSRENKGWESLTAWAKEEFSRAGLRRMSDQGRVMGIANMLIKRAREVRHAYTWGGGVTISAKDSQVNEVIQAFLDDESNTETYSGAQARQMLEGELFDEGNSFRAHYTNPITGRVQVRYLPFDEIETVVSAPGDKATPRYYLRRWSELDPATGEVVFRTKAYPALKFQPEPKNRLDSVKFNGDEYPLDWDTPVRHIKVNAGRNATFGIGDSYAALPWAMLYKGFLEDWAALMKTLAKIAYEVRSGSSAASQQKRAQIQATLNSSAAGGIANLGGDATLEPMAKSGATLDSESARPLGAAVAAAVGLPVTILMADPGQTGARAVASTLDRPTRLTFEARRELHAEADRDTLSYVIECAVLCPQGALQGKGEELRQDDRVTVKFNDVADASVDIVWPSLDDVDIKTMIDSISVAADLPDMPRLPMIKAALAVLGIQNMDEVIDEITDDDGNLVSQDTNAGDVATRAFRNGQDPAEAL